MRGSKGKQPKGSDTTNPIMIRYIFGMNCDIKQDSQLYDSKILFYSAGQYFVRYNMEDKSQDFSHGYVALSSITALCLNQDRT